MPLVGNRSQRSLRSIHQALSGEGLAFALQHHSTNGGHGAIALTRLRKTGEQLNIGRALELSSFSGKLD